MTDWALPAPIAALNVYDKALLAAGVFSGVVQKEDCQELELCFQNMDSEATLIHDGLVKMHEGPLHFAQGLQEIYEAAAEMPLAWSDCHSVQDDLLVLEAWIAGIEAHQPGLKDWIEANAMDHKLVLTNDYVQAKLDFNNGRYFQAGQVLGKMLVIVTQ